MSARNLVVCIDGTSNKFGRRNTNVVKLYRQIELDTEAGSDRPRQHAYYSSGIGTHAKNLPLLHRVEKVISDWFDMALAWNVEENVKDAYGWLARNYRQGDRIYLFGFSRGAYQVRVLASLIHEVGLIRTPTEKQIEMAFGHYRSIHPHKPETREMAIEFKKTYCWWGVRIHFVGVWDTVSSVGLIKGDVFISTSASVTNASHFRHALALDELRVKFMPEYFREMNAHRKNMLRPNADGDIQEVWFSGCHADVGGVTRLGQPYHAGNVSLSWMQDEASEHGLALKPSDLTCTPEDVRSGRSDSLKIWWCLLEIMFPFRHQVSFTGAGKNKLKWHWFRPRRIIPGQRIHLSVWCGDAYRPRATLGSGIEIPIVLEGSSGGAMRNRPLETDLFYGTMPTGLAMVLAWIQRYAARQLADLLKSKLETPTDQDRDKWSAYIADQSGFDKFVSITAYVLAFDLVNNETGIERLIGEAKECLELILDAEEHPDLVRVLSLLPLMTMNQTLRQGLVVASRVTSALVRVLDCSVKSRNDSTLSLVVDSICHLLQAELRDDMATQLAAEPVPEGTSGLTILSKMLGIHNPSYVLAALRMIVLLPAGHTSRDHIRQRLKPKVRKLAKRGRGSIGLMAVSAFEVLRGPNDHARDLEFSNVLAYLSGSLMLDVEGNRDSSLACCGDRPPLSIDDFQNNRRIIRKINLATMAYCTGQRTAATLTLLKLCRYPALRKYFLDEGALDNFVRQLRRKRTSLLAAYALMMCLKNSIWDPSVEEIQSTIGPSVVSMLRRGWFDDAVGLVEGFEIFHQLMGHEMLKREIQNGIYKALKKELENRKHDRIRTSLLCIDILEDRRADTGLVAPGSPNSTAHHVTPRNFESSLVTRLVNDSLKCLRNEHWIKQRKCIKILSALSQTDAGAKAMLSRVDEIVEMLLPEWREEGEQVIPPGNRPIPPSRMLGPSYALYSLSRNESLRNKIRESKRYATLKGRYFSGSLVNGPDTPVLQLGIRTPNKNDVLVMVARMIKAVDEGFYYDGIGSIPEVLPVVIRHISNLSVLLRNTAALVLQLLPGLAIHRATTAISRGANRLRRGTGLATQGQASTQGPSLSNLRTAEPGVVALRLHEWLPVSPTQHQVPPVLTDPSSSVPQTPRSNDEQEHVDVDVQRNCTQEMITPNPATQFITQSPPGIREGSYHSQLPEDNDDQIVEEPRDVRGLDVFSVRRDDVQHDIAPRLDEVPTSDPLFVPTEHPEPATGTVSLAREMPSSTSPLPPSGLIALKDFTACDLPTKKCLKLISPRARLKVHVGNHTFVSPAVKIGNQPADGMRSRTHWQWDFPQPSPAAGERIEIMIERRFLFKYTCIRHTVPTSTRLIQDNHTGPYTGFIDTGLPLYKGPPNGP